MRECAYGHVLLFSSDCHCSVLVCVQVRFAEKTRRWEFEEAPLANLVNLMLTDLVSEITGQSVVPTYAFPVYYVSGGHIWPHLDVAENEISLTMQLELTPQDGEVCACVHVSVSCVRVCE